MPMNDKLVSEGAPIGLIFNLILEIKCICNNTSIQKHGHHKLKIGELNKVIHYFYENALYRNREAEVTLKKKIENHLSNKWFAKDNRLCIKGRIARADLSWLYDVTPPAHAQYSNSEQKRLELSYSVHGETCLRINFTGISVRIFIVHYQFLYSIQEIQ
ncbi:unnamed protein product [Leptidea sinapis]|uniref:Uncharacterized protein n=1 Tax=Leptidea sinapis TaxID=189913 RepID=A0A5E4Q5K1_9NEOP|nr:unnamed protein product [Leptidea sinapis]